MSAPLDGTLVVDLTRLLPGPLATRLLADLGARVVKVEEPSLGDPVRMAPPQKGGVGTLGALLLGGVESVALDLKREPAREVLTALLERADVLVESFRPGTLARLGFPPDELLERHPRLVVASLSGWGQDGPRAGRAGHDLTYQAIAGTLAPSARMPPVPLADLAGAWSAALAITAALLRRERTGRGGRVDASLYDGALAANLTNWAEESAASHPVGKRLALSGALPCYNLYATADGGYVALACLEPHFWEAFCDAVERPDLVKRQFEIGVEARRAVQELIGSHSRDHWAALGEQHDLPLDPVLSAGEALEEPQSLRRAVVGHAEDGGLRVAFPAKLDGERPQGGEKVPKLGAQTDDWLDELGIEMGRGDRKRGGIGTRRAVKRAAARWAMRRKGPRL